MNRRLFRRVRVGRMLLKSILATASEMATFFTFWALPSLGRTIPITREVTLFCTTETSFAIFLLCSHSISSYTGFLTWVCHFSACFHSRTLCIASPSEMFLTSSSFFRYQATSQLTDSSLKLQCLACFFLSGPGTCQRILVSVVPCDETCCWYCTLSSAQKRASSFWIQT